MTPRMKWFLTEAASCAVGKGIQVGKYEKHIAAKAINDGFGTMYSCVVSVFVINDAGREAVSD